MTGRKRVKWAFEAEVLSIPLAAIDPSKTIEEKVKRSVKFPRISASALRRMRPLRQIEVVELMMAAGNVTGCYAKVLLAGTRQVDVVNPEKVRKTAGLRPNQLERMQREIEAVQTDFKAVEKTFGSDVIELVVATGYLGRLIQNRQVQVHQGESPGISYPVQVNRKSDHP